MKELMEHARILALLNSIQRSVFKFVHEKTLKEFNIHPGQIPILFILRKEEGLSQKEIAKRIGVEQGTIAVMLRRMEKNGLVRRVPDEQDRRITRVYLTEKSEDVLKSLAKIVKEAEELLVGGLSDEEKQEVENILKKLQNNIKRKVEDNCLKEV
ncbi:DNA-binding transcriptional regulator, MarR family [Fervidobacterium changbaicum]|uniref:MarR family transcriptional regulator n=1 Tax=Fervidobacterium islandicum TaxID=2423 RepID=A0AAI8CKS1_FERIS|nr:MULTISPECIES: MarR family transcriptional regulator [Fervidobacterium]AMW32237.1 MarR family transcriptional regulator [Fervidobacterium islandicum]SDH19075.1 DNA-binding transcriptional regulator, MarR family [Fervidobacterium changbaicum]